MTSDATDRNTVARIIAEKPLSGAYDEMLFGSDRGNTLWVMFSDQYGSQEWIGKFGCGNYAASRVLQAGADDHFMISAGGFCYVIDATRRTLLNKHADKWAKETIYDPGRNRFIVSDEIRIKLCESGKEVWASRRIALDGLHDLVLDGNIVRGKAVTGYDGEEEDFSVNLDTGEVTCKTDYSNYDRELERLRTQASKKPWWKFW